MECQKPTSFGGLGLTCRYLEEVNPGPAAPLNTQNFCEIFALPLFFFFFFLEAFRHLDPLQQDKGFLSGSQDVWFCRET